MNASADVSALLERLVAQFASPYDFLRELVQNAMDAGSDRVEVTLESHPVEGGSDDELVFELTVADTGRGMDETTVDNELTRLFSTGKAEDRTMAGGFGIGFVSVFAWEPEAVLLQTGRAGESIELLFGADRTFEKHVVDTPVEGTTIILYRRGRAAERDAVSDAIRDALWRWCRYCPLEITFEDFDTGEPPELIEDRPDPPEGALVATDERGDSRLQVAFGVPAHAVLMRRGLILAEGSPRQILPDVAERLGRTVEHLRVWADSPLLRTTMARDKVVDDDGRVEIGRRIATVVEALRADLFRRLETLVGETEVWTTPAHGQYGMLHGHLLLECVTADGDYIDELRRRRILRAVGERVEGGSTTEASIRGWSLKALARKLDGRPMLVDAPETAELRVGLMQALASYDLPVLAGSVSEDGNWIEELAEAGGLSVRAVEDAVSRVEPLEAEAVALCGLVGQLLHRGGIGAIRPKLGRLIDVHDVDPPLFGVEPRPRQELGKAPAVPVALHGGPMIPMSASRNTNAWLNRDHLLVQAAMKSFAASPLVAATTLAMAILGRLGPGAPSPADVARVADELEDAG